MFDRFGCDVAILERLASYAVRRYLPPTASRTSNARSATPMLVNVSVI